LGGPSDTRVARGREGEEKRGQGEGGAVGEKNPDEDFK